MKLGIIFSYWLRGRTSRERTQFNRKFLGFTDKSQFGKYSYRREGLMSKIPHVYVSNSLFIILEEDLEKVERFCREFDVPLFVRRVILEDSDIKELSA
jgi:hypothetical protein